MTDDPELESSNAFRSKEEMIVEVDAADLERARAAIAGGVQAAREAWIPVHLIVDALVLELTGVARATGIGPQLAAYLRALADAVEQGHRRYDA